MQRTEDAELGKGTRRAGGGRMWGCGCVPDPKIRQVDCATTRLFGGEGRARLWLHLFVGVGGCADCSVATGIPLGGAPSDLQSPLHGRKPPPRHPPSIYPTNVAAKPIPLTGDARPQFPHNDHQQQALLEIRLEAGLKWSLLARSKNDLYAKGDPQCRSAFIR